MVNASLDPRLSFDNFVVGKSNRWPMLWPCAWRRPIIGAVQPAVPLMYGVGLQDPSDTYAIARHIQRKKPENGWIYLSAEKFMYQFIRALCARTRCFKEQFRSVDVLMVDDVQFIIGKGSTQEEFFFHTFNALFDQNRQVVLSADKSPNPDLEGPRSGCGRVSAGAWSPISIRPPTSFASASCKPGRAIAGGDPQKVLEFLAHRISSTYASWKAPSPGSLPMPRWWADR